MNRISAMAPRRKPLRVLRTVTDHEVCVPVPAPGSPMVSATVARLIFFGGRYFSLLFVAYLLGDDATGFLLSVAIVELFRIIFDYGLENNVLARLHQKDFPAAQGFARGKGYFRLLATVLGQLVTSGVIALVCLKSEIPLGMPLIASLQFTFLMGFGYVQAHLQTGDSQGMAALVRPLGLALLIQSALLVLAREEVIPIWWCMIFFEVVSLSASVILAKRHEPERDIETSVLPKTLARHAPAALGGVFKSIAPLGNVALLGVAYTRVDALAVSLVASGTLLTQYLLYQRLASAPLMFFSTLASVSIARLSSSPIDVVGSSNGATVVHKYAGILAVLSGVGLAAVGPLTAQLFSLESLNWNLLVVQCTVLALQVLNGFRAASLIARHESLQLWKVARNNSMLAMVILPAGAGLSGVFGVAVALCVIEMFCAAQYFRFHSLSQAARSRDVK